MFAYMQMLAYFHDRLTGPAAADVPEATVDQDEEDAARTEEEQQQHQQVDSASQNVNVNVVFRTAAQDNWTCSFESDDPTLEMVRNLAKEVCTVRNCIISCACACKFAYAFACVRARAGFV